jgi:hypothetical protein
MAKKPLEIDACAGSQLRDTQGEMLSVEGADISELQAGKGRWNDNHGKGFFNSVGRITHAKKIFKEEDCDDDRQKYYWNKVKAPYVYVKGYLYDDEDHPNAKAAAAILRNVHKTDCPLKLKASVEGGVISRGISDPSLLARTKIHSVALTFTPANVATLVEPLSLDKSQYDEVADMELIRSVIHLAETNVPSFRHIARDASASKVRSNIEKIVHMMKGDNSIDIPTKQEILQYALEAKIQNNVSTIHDMIEQELNKGMGGAAMGAAMMGAAALAPQTAQAPAPAVGAETSQRQVNLTNMPKEHQAFYQNVAKKNPLLGAIGMVESSGGRNYAHKTITDPKSMHAGHTAGGMFAMMPNQAEYILRNDPKLASKYPRLVEAAKDMKTNHGVFTNAFNSDPATAYDFADSLLKRNKSKTKDINMLIHSWNHGLKGTWDRYKNEGPEAIQDADYVKKVLETYKKLAPHHAKKPAKHLKKALCAGYGGSGAPTSNTAGGVLQSEALDDGRGVKDKNFKYISCDDCGKEQIYSKYQVKCRDCGKSFPMEKLHKLFLGAIAT